MGGGWKGVGVGVQVGGELTDGVPLAVLPGQVEGLQCSSVITTVPLMQALAEVQTCSQQSNAASGSGLNDKTG